MKRLLPLLVVLGLFAACGDKVEQAKGTRLEIDSTLSGDKALSGYRWFANASWGLVKHKPSRWKTLSYTRFVGVFDLEKIKPFIGHDLCIDRAGLQVPVVGEAPRYVVFFEADSKTGAGIVKNATIEGLSWGRVADPRLGFLKAVAVQSMPDARLFCAWPPPGPPEPLLHGLVARPLAWNGTDPAAPCPPCPPLAAPPGPPAPEIGNATGNATGVFQTAPNATVRNATIRNATGAQSIRIPTGGNLTGPKIAPINP